MALLSHSLLGLSPKMWLMAVLPFSFVIYYLLWIVYARTVHPLAKVPGPFWPSISRTWLMYRMHVGDLELAQRALHKQYGSLIRIAPDEVSTSNPEHIPRIFPIVRPLEKTNWYLAFRPPGIGSRPDMFTGIDEKEHSAYRRIVGGVYSLSSILKNEAYIDDCITLFTKRMGEFADGDQEIDFGLWLEQGSCEQPIHAFKILETLSFRSRSIYCRYIFGIALMQIHV